MINIIFTSQSVVEIKKHNAEYKIKVQNKPGIVFQWLFGAKSTYRTYIGSYTVFNDADNGWRAGFDTETWLGKCLDRHKFLEDNPKN